jgi:hypothetical protein
LFRFVDDPSTGACATFLQEMQFLAVFTFIQKLRFFNKESEVVGRGHRLSG